MSLDNLSIYQNVTYSSLLEYLNASKIFHVRSDHESYVHDGGGANLVLTERSLTCH